MILSRFTIKNIDSSKVQAPADAIFELPEKVLQFGTGVLLRGLPDYFIDKANRQGIFNGRIVVVKSTSQGDTSAFEKQDGLYTLCIRGIEEGKKVEENIINSSISRVLNAQEEWEQVLECAHNIEMQIIISNTTEVGIQFVQEDVRHHPPKSFPGKVLAFLYERWKAFGGSSVSGMVIVPTELVPENGKKLESIVLELAHLNSLEDEAIEWIENHNSFCNSLVDRIVPGKPEGSKASDLENELGYSDSLLAVSEVYRLWAIEGDDKVKNVLSFAGADEGMVIRPNIDLQRELKLRLLNGTHTLSCGIAFLSNCSTVREAMEDEALSGFISSLLHSELAPSIPYAVSSTEAREFGNKVLDRFRNPHIMHQWISITMNYTSKMKMRCVPVLIQHYKNSDSPPSFFALGFAAYIAFMHATEKKGNKFYGNLNEVSYLIQDEEAETFYKRWSGLSLPSLVKETLADTSLWGTNLSALPNFIEEVTNNLISINNEGMRETLEKALAKIAVTA